MKVCNAKHGRGIFSTKSYQTGDTIEESPVIVLNESDTEIIDNTLLYDYYFSWGKSSKKAAIALGNGSLFNHSYTPNAKYIKKLNRNIIKFVAIKPIENGEEILVNYNGSPNSKKLLWFKADAEY